MKLFIEFRNNLLIISFNFIVNNCKIESFFRFDCKCLQKIDLQVVVNYDEDVF